MSKKKTVTNAMRMLTAAKIKFDAVEYECDEVGENFGEEISHITGIPPEKSFKTLVMRGDKTGVIVVCIPVCNEADLKKIAKVSGNKKVEMIHVKELLGLTGYIRGGVSPIGMKKRYKTVFHSSALEQKTVTVSAGRIGYQISLAPHDLISLSGATTADIIR